MAATFEVPDALLPVDPKPLALPDKPSIAVLPLPKHVSRSRAGLFRRRGGGRHHHSAVPVQVAVRYRPYKGRLSTSSRLGGELGVRYVLEGSVRKAGSRLRIAGQLIDVTTSPHLWADRFDGALEDIFDLRDKVTQQMAGAIAPELERAEIERAS
jgi:TolB-like protein